MFFLFLRLISCLDVVLYGHIITSVLMDAVIFRKASVWVVNLKLPAPNVQNLARHLSCWKAHEKRTKTRCACCHGRRLTG